MILVLAIGTSGCVTHGDDGAAEYFTENQGLNIAKQFVMNSPTYLFDGSGLEPVRTLEGGCEGCMAFIFGFESSHAGYGNRAGQMLAQVITPHTAVVEVNRSGVVSGVLDGKWNMLKQELLDGGAGLANPASVYCERQGWNLTMIEDESGTLGYCNVPGKGLCEEWALFRSDGKNCIPERR